MTLAKAIAKLSEWVQEESDRAATMHPAAENARAYAQGAVGAYVVALALIEGTADGRRALKREERVAAKRAEEVAQIPGSA